MGGDGSGVGDDIFLDCFILLIQDYVDSTPTLTAGRHTYNCDFLHCYTNLQEWAYSQVSDRLGNFGK